MNIENALEQKNDCVCLEESTQYKDYFSLLTRASMILGQWYQRMVEGGSGEEKIVAAFLGKLVYTTKLLALKYACFDRPMLKLDLHESGYPHVVGIMALEADLRHREEELRRINMQPLIKQAMLEHMFEKHEEPAELLATMSLRVYFEELVEERILLPFTPGELILNGENDKTRNYMFSWCCYDGKTNVPHVYIMVFDQDLSEEPLHNGGTSYVRFMDVVRGEGGRVPDLNVVAIGIDQCIESIHPKVLKRIKLGPLLSPVYSREAHPILEYLKTYGKADDFAFHIRDEMVFSARQIQKKGSWLEAGAVREIFAVSQDDVECAKAGVSRINRMLVIPHHIMQHLDLSDPAVTQYQTKVGYTKKGEVHAI